MLDGLAASTSVVKGKVRLYKVGDTSKWLTANFTALASPSGYRNLTIGNVAVSGEPLRRRRRHDLLGVHAIGDKGDVGGTRAGAGRAGAAQGVQGDPGTDGTDGEQGPQGAPGTGIAYDASGTFQKRTPMMARCRALRLADRRVAVPPVDEGQQHVRRLGQFHERRRRGRRPRLDRRRADQRPSTTGASSSRAGSVAARGGRRRAAFTGAAYEVTIDTTNWRPVLHDETASAVARSRPRPCAGADRLGSHRLLPTGLTLWFLLR